MMELRDRKAGVRARTLVAALLAGTMLAGGGLAWSEAGAATDAAPPRGLAPVSNQAGFADLVAKVRPAVVNIAVTERAQQATDETAPAQQPLPFPPDSPFGQMFQQFNQQRQQQQQNAAPRHALGSGFIIDPSGYIVTNNHVVDGASKVTVTLENGQAFPAKVIGRDAKTDLALIKVDAGKPLPYVAFGNSDKERVGDWVVAVGNPFGLGGTVTAGIVSAHDRNLDNGPYDDYLQIDAPINPGNSGGPLFNQSGQVIGIDTAIYSPSGGSVGIGFAIPSNLAKDVVAQLRQHGKVERGWLGVEMQPLTPALAKAIGRPDAEGVIVDQVVAHSPAAAAKLQQGDVITAYDGKPIKNARDLALAVADTAHGSAAKLTIWRNGQQHVVDVAIGRQPGPQVASSNEAPDGTPVGMALAPLTPKERGDLGLAPTVSGVVVAQVMPGSHAADSGIQPGDIIERVGDAAVATPAEAASALHKAEHAKKTAVPLLVMRNGATYFLALQLANA
jgi:serine protease Do